MIHFTRIVETHWRKLQYTCEIFSSSWAHSYNKVTLTKYQFYIIHAYGIYKIKSISCLLKWVLSKSWDWMIIVVLTVCSQKFKSSWVVCTQVTNISLVMTLILLSPKESPGLHDLRNFLLFLTSAEISQRTLYLTRVLAWQDKGVVQSCFVYWEACHFHLNILILDIVCFI